MCEGLFPSTLNRKPISITEPTNLAAIRESYRDTAANGHDVLSELRISSKIPRERPIRVFRVPGSRSTASSVPSTSLQQCPRQPLVRRLLQN